VSRLVFVFVLLTVLLTVVPVSSARAASFCGKADLSQSIMTYTAGPTRVVRRELTSGIVGCSKGMSYGAVTNCTRHSSGAILAWKFTAVGPTGVSGSMDLCKWSCTNAGGPSCVVTANMQNGLPVELLSFGLE